MMVELSVKALQMVESFHARRGRARIRLIRWRTKSEQFTSTKIRRKRSVESAKCLLLSFRSAWAGSGGVL